MCLTLSFFTAICSTVVRAVSYSKDWHWRHSAWHKRAIAIRRQSCGYSHLAEFDRRISCLSVRGLTHKTSTCFKELVLLPWMSCFMQSFIFIYHYISTCIMQALENAGAAKHIVFRLTEPLNSQSMVILKIVNSVKQGFPQFFCHCTVICLCQTMTFGKPSLRHHACSNQHW